MNDKQLNKMNDLKSLLQKQLNESDSKKVVHLIDFVVELFLFFYDFLIVLKTFVLKI